MKSTRPTKALARSVAVAVFALAAVLLASPTASAFCGFYVSGADGKLFNDATQVVLMREGTRVVLSMQNDYAGPVRDFAMVVPVPVVLQKENVKTLSRELFAKIDQLSAPRLVEYWEEDPCHADSLESGLAGISGGGRGGGLAGLGGGTGAGSSVKIEAQFEVGEYEIVILSAQDSGGLDAWLRANNYKIPDNAEPALRPYVNAGSKFFVAKVNASKVKFDNGRAQLSPLRFHYDTETFQLPVKLGMLNSSGTQDLIVYVLAPNEQRYEVANYPQAVIPTNLDVAESARGSFPSFYTSLFDKTLEANPRAVVTEYAWGAQTCDPCPGSVQGLTMEDLASLGADVLPSAKMGQPGQGSSNGPRADVQVAAEMGTAKIHDADRVIAGLRPRLRACYRTGLNSDPSMAGSLAITVTAAADGSVAKAEVTTNTGISPGVASCTTGMLRRAQFANGGTFVVKLRLATQDEPKPAPTAAAPNDVLLAIGNGFVLTRLHTRYSSGALAEDLVFKVAEPLMGGREQRLKDGRLEHGALVGGKARGDSNAFQARYAIRRSWTGPITCDKPIRDRWGGPWPDAGVVSGGSGAAAATKLAYAPRDKQLASFLPKGLPDFHADVAPLVIPDAGSPPAAASAAATATALADGGTDRPAKGRCGCEAVGVAGGAASPLALAVGVLGALFRARRRRIAGE